ncbi:DUF4382 domain-containing protein [Cyclobacterium jeungdonense]|uniref:DUF4382 domain-containing protein n=1 Tax=Cyclobacterium jeungdonense TaxID=708087 RepID=A0ABT8C7Q5_9BACT|nr:DUF4382 domain-containing protein [Cyclobacterium jeungdonense]MDN3687691.1 DUF4382 domain-containing protein [Cyclobacterium jeungdonense]
MEKLKSKREGPAVNYPGMNILNRLLLFCLLPGCLAACEDASLENRSLVNILLIDAPGDFDEVWIEVLGVEVLPSGVRGSAENASWIDIPYQAASNTVRISDLVNDQRLLIGRAEIQSGTISGIRLRLGEEMYLVRDEIRIDLTPSSILEELLDLEVSIDVESGLSYDVYIDFDLAQSIQQSPGESFQLIPEIRAFVTDQTAAIRGTVVPRNLRPHIFAINNTDTLATLTESTGGFYLKGLPPTDYGIFIDAPSGYLDTAFRVSTKPDTVIALPNITLQPQNP